MGAGVGTGGGAGARTVTADVPLARALRARTALPRLLFPERALRRYGASPGRDSADGTQTRAILAIDSTTGRVTRAGQLPRAASDMGAASLGGKIVLAGGRDSSGRVLAQVLELAPR